MPPPASHMVKASMWWLRPIVSRFSPIGVRPNSPPQIDQRVVEQAALLQVLDQRRARPVDCRGRPCRGRLSRFVAGAAVVVPVGVVELHEPHAALDQPAGQQAVVGERRLARLGAVQLQRLLASRRRGRSAPGRWSASGRPSRRRRCAWRSRGRRSSSRRSGSGRGWRRAPRAAGRRVMPGGLDEVEDRLAAGAERHALVGRRQEAAAPS